MSTYEMTFKTKIESISVTSRQMVVEYFDPHGDESIRVTLTVNFNDTPEDIKKTIIGNTPHQYFHNRYIENEAIKNNNISHDELYNLVGETLEYNLPSYDNEVI